MKPDEISSFLVIAAKLVQIKSEALLPRPIEREPGEEDPGVELVELPLTELEAMALPEKLYDAVMACRKITAHGARLRQEMYIAKVLRGVDVEPIRDTLARRNEVDRQRVRRERLIEQWRERLLADEPAAWTELASLVDPASLQPLRSLARQARAEQAAARPPAAARQLFRRLREALDKASI